MPRVNMVNMEQKTMGGRLQFQRILGPSDCSGSLS